MSLSRFVPPRLVEASTGLALSPDEVLVRASAVAGGLVEQGVRPGDHVVFDAPVTVDSVLAYLACWRVGAVACPLHHRLTGVERGALIDRLQPTVVLEPGLTGAPVEPHEGSPDDLAVLLATSGSSGQPKLVRHLAGRLAYKGPVMRDVHGLTPEDVILLPAPMAHISGLLNGILLPGAAGMTAVLVERWSAADALRWVGEHGVTFMIGPPTYFAQLRLEEGFSSAAVESLRLISCGGAGVTAKFAEDTAGAFGCVVKRTYGSTEAPTVTTAWAGDTAAQGWTTDGRAVGDVQLRLDGEELLVQGSELFDGYEGLPSPFDGGWFRTGDRARIDDGWVTILGRLGDGIIRGGENVDPVEVELVCGTLPGVRQVVVVGVPDDVMGERVGLVTVGATFDAAEVRAHCTAAGLARFKTPEVVLRLDDLPVLTVGKPDRKALSRLLAGQDGGTG